MMGHLFFVSVLILSCGATPQADFFVAPNGADANPGSFERPFASLARARDAVRALGQPDRDITVLIRGGEYQLTETVVFGLADGAAAGRSITYAAYPGERPVFGSGQRVTGWQPLEDPPDFLPAAARGEVWVADVSGMIDRKSRREDPAPGVGEPPDPRDRTRFSSLFMGDQRLPRASSAGFHAVPGAPGTPTQMTLPLGAIEPWPDLAEAELRVVPSRFWIQNLLPIKSVEDGVATLARPATYPLGQNSMQTRPSCFVENSLAVLDQPGEWVLHAEAKRLYYWPRGERPEAEIVAPLLSEFIRMEGKIDYAGPSDRPVRGLVLQGLTFRHGDRLSWHGGTGWGLQHDWEMFDRPSALVRLRGAEDCAVLDCEFTNTAHTAIRLDLHARNNRIEGNHIHDVGGVGVLLAGYGPGTKDVNRGNRVVNNYLHHIGWMYWGSPALFVWQSGHNLLARNHIHHTPYTGVVISGRIAWARNGQGECARTCRFEELDAVLGENHQRPDWQGRQPFLHARHNVLEYNEIHNVMERIGDGNAIYVSGCGTGNIVRRNWCHDNFGEYMNAVLRNDDDQHGSVFEGNIVVRSGGHGEGIINKGANLLRHNIVADLRPVHRHRSYLVLVNYPQHGAVHRGNVYYAGRPDQTAISEHSGRHKLPPRLADMESDGNLYFSTADPDWGQAVLRQFRPQGVEAASLAADPMFAAPDNDDYRFRPGSPALDLGIPQPVSVDQCGLEPAYRERWILPRLRTRIEPGYGKVAPDLRVAITVDDPQAEIRYTTDGREPTVDSALYTGPFALADGHVVRARAFAPGRVDLTGAFAWFEPPPEPVREDFAAVPVGAVLPGATTVEETPLPFTARVSDEHAASGTRSLKFVDGPGQKHAFNPHAYYRRTFTSGAMVGRFALRASTESEFYYQWRKYEGGRFVRGPSVRVNPGGRLVHGERQLMTIPIDAWVRIQVAAELGEGLGQTFELRVTLPDGTARVFSDLPSEPGFDRLDWVGFVSVANHACVTYVDEILVAPRH
jgi:hypothetical protein